MQTIRSDYVLQKQLNFIWPHPFAIFITELYCTRGGRSARTKQSLDVFVANEIIWNECAYVRADVPTASGHRTCLFENFSHIARFSFRIGNTMRCDAKILTFRRPAKRHWFLLFWTDWWPLLVYCAKAFNFHFPILWFYDIIVRFVVPFSIYSVTVYVVFVAVVVAQS